MERVDRQERIPQWEQDKVYESSVLLLGSSSLAQYVLAGLLGMQVGSVTLMDATRVDAIKASGIGSGELMLPSLSLPSYLGKSKVEVLAAKAAQMNKFVEVVPLHAGFIPELAEGFDVIIDATNDAATKSRSFAFARKQGIPYVGAVATPSIAEVFSFDPAKCFPENSSASYAYHDHHGKPQGIVAAGLVAGIVVDELRKHLFLLKERERKLTKGIVYNRFSSARFSTKADFLADTLFSEKEGDYASKHTLIVGAGALGTFAALGLAQSGVGSITLVDDDTISESNLNRQLLFYERVGKKKVSVLEERLQEMAPSITFHAYAERADAALLQELTAQTAEHPYDVVLSCVDNIEGRILLNEYCIAKHIPLIEGGTDAYGGQVTSFVPGYNACLDCQVGLKQAFARLQEKQSLQPTSCIADDHAASVVYVNQVIGFGMVNEALQALAGRETLNGRMFYNTFDFMRAGVELHPAAPSPGCVCSYGVE